MGDCDAHLKNFSLVRQDRAGKSALRLAPAYDLVCTTRFERFSRDMAIAIGGMRDIDAITPRLVRTPGRRAGHFSHCAQAAARTAWRGCTLRIQRGRQGNGRGHAGSPLVSCRRAL
ncbi:MAG: HipA domain-containing protein [Coriobacteriales bacterium]